MKKIILIAIVTLAFLLRFWRLDSFPALNADEAAIGYNAYSLIQTGKDEHGNTLPIHFQSFNDYKPGLYFYLVLPFVKILGLNEWTVRLPGATVGVLTVLVLYFLVKELKIGNSLKIRNLKLGIEEIAAFMLAISPWHIHFSKGAWEVNASTFFITLGVWLFVKSANQDFKFKYIVLSFLAFVASLYTYHSARIVVPVLGLGLLMFYREKLVSKYKSFLVACLISLILVLPLARELLKPEAVSRAAGVGLFADTGPLSRINEQRGEHGDFTGIFAKVFHNKAVNYGFSLVSNWAEHYWGEFLFLSGDEIQRNKVPETGQLYLFEIVTLGIGLLLILRNIKGLPRAESRGWRLVLWWLAIAPVGAALTFQSPHSLRSHNMVIPLTVISAYGLLAILDFVNKNKKIKTLGFLLVSLIIIWSLGRYLHMYYVHMAKEYPFSSQYGLRELVSYVNQNQDEYQDMIVTDRYDQPYILFLFYLKYPPEDFQGRHELTPRDQFGFSTVDKFDKFKFMSIDFDKVRPENPNSLIIGTDEEIPEEANIVENVYGDNGYLYFQVVAN